MSRYTCVCHQGSKKGGAATAVAMQPAAVQSISYKTAGITTCMRRDIENITVMTMETTMMTMVEVETMMVAREVIVATAETTN